MSPATSILSPPYLLSLTLILLPVVSAVPSPTRFRLPTNYFPKFQEIGPRAVPRVQRFRRSGITRGGGVRVGVGETLGVGVMKAFGLFWPLGLYWLFQRQVPVGDNVKIKLSNSQWREKLTSDQGTERAFTSPLNNEKRKGLYRCAGCDVPLFPSDTKFNSGTGWPSFWAPEKESIEHTIHPVYLLGDFGAREVRCKACGGHLGHMFTDGPKPTGKRYCINGVSLYFDPQDTTSGSTDAKPPNY
ncbi:hypothetical protein AAMO2058_001399500 [Amorphochlora amoebiformis]